MTIPNDAEQSRPVVGYYRYTDIRFEWFKALPEDCKEQLQSFLFPTCLTSQYHPLCIETGGLELILGTIKSSGETRLLFSSAQIEYTRYWLYEMELTPTRIPLPRSQYLITPDKLRTLSPVVYKSDSELKKAQKDLMKANKRLKGVDLDMQDMRDAFERVRKLYQKHDTRATWCAIDIEDWEYMHEEVTEFGYSLVYWDGQDEKRETVHWIVKGTPRNGKYVPDARDHFLFGTSEEIAKKELPGRVRDLFARLSQRGPVFLVFHDWTNDIKQLATFGVVTKDIKYSVPDELPTEGIFCVDTRRLFGALEGHKEPKSLSRICRILGLQDLERFHNAGNDAEYTMKCLVSMASGLPIDVQREQRWPAAATDIIPNVKRQYAREAKPEDESDYEDPYAW